MKRLTTAAICILLLPAICAAAMAENTLKVGVRANVPEFSCYNEETETWSGMETDLAWTLATDLGYDDVQYIAVDTDTREEALKSGECDCVIALYTVTEARKESLDFSEPYYTDACRVLIENSTMFTALKDLLGMTVGVRKNSTAARALADYMAMLGYTDPVNDDTFDPNTYDGGFTFSVFDSESKMIHALEIGEIDACCADNSLLFSYITDERSLLGDKLSEENYAVATPKGSELSARIDELIKQYLQDGTLWEIIDRWELDHGNDKQAEGAGV